MPLSTLDRSTIDDAIRAALSTLRDAQKAYYDTAVVDPATKISAKRSHYRQVTKTLTAIPNLSYEQHRYEGPQGSGWILHVWFTNANGETWHMQQDQGPEGRDSSWTLVPTRV